MPTPSNGDVSKVFLTSSHPLTFRNTHPNTLSLTLTHTQTEHEKRHWKMENFDGRILEPG